MRQLKSPQYETTTGDVADRHTPGRWAKQELDVHVSPTADMHDAVVAVAVAVAVAVTVTLAKAGALLGRHGVP